MLSSPLKEVIALFSSFTKRKSDLHASKKSRYCLYSSQSLASAWDHHLTQWLKESWSPYVPQASWLSGACFPCYFISKIIQKKFQQLSLCTTFFCSRILWQSPETCSNLNTFDSWSNAALGATKIYNKIEITVRNCIMVGHGIFVIQKKIKSLNFQPPCPLTVADQRYLPRVVFQCFSYELINIYVFICVYVSQDLIPL